MRKPSPRRHRSPSYVTIVRTRLDTLAEHVLTAAQLRSTCEWVRRSGRLPASHSFRRFVSELVQAHLIAPARLEFAAPYSTVIRYTHGDSTLLQVVASVRATGYFSHYTALYLHQLTEQSPRTVYFNVEQSPKPAPAAAPTQATIAAAFKGRQRTTRCVAEFRGHRVHILSGKNSGNAGVEDLVTPHDGTLRVTSLERTLIDATVRPAYSGGVQEVLNAFRTAAPRASHERLLDLLDHLDYAYPYHQAIGFYMERAGGYPATALEALRARSVALLFIGVVFLADALVVLDILDVL